VAFGLRRLRRSYAVNLSNQGGSEEAPDCFELKACEKGAEDWLALSIRRHFVRRSSRRAKQNPSTKEKTDASHGVGQSDQEQ